MLRVASMKNEGKASEEKYGGTLTTLLKILGKKPETISSGKATHAP
ncbi:MAG: hypothetical protein QXF52_08650 [Thermoproteota archaeon]